MGPLLTAHSASPCLRRRGKQEQAPLTPRVQQVVGHK
ncbi:hypothetical protein HaLaN_33141, partial [Haematococcus lacustris]